MGEKMNIWVHKHAHKLVQTLNVMGICKLHNSRLFTNQYGNMKKCIDFIKIHSLKLITGQFEHDNKPHSWQAKI